MNPSRVGPFPSQPQISRTADEPTKIIAKDKATDPVNEDKFETGTNSSSVPCIERDLPRAQQPTISGGVASSDWKLGSEGFRVPNRKTVEKSAPDWKGFEPDIAGVRTVLKKVIDGTLPANQGAWETMKAITPSSVHRDISRLQTLQSDAQRDPNKTPEFLLAADKVRAAFDGAPDSLKKSGVGQIDDQKRSTTERALRSDLLTGANRDQLLRALDDTKTAQSQATILDLTAQGKTNTREFAVAQDHLAKISKLDGGNELRQQRAQTKDEIRDLDVEIGKASGPRKEQLIEKRDQRSRFLQELDHSGERADDQKYLDTSKAELANLKTYRNRSLAPAESTRLEELIARKERNITRSGEALTNRARNDSADERAHPFENRIERANAELGVRDSKVRKLESEIAPLRERFDSAQQAEDANKRAPASERFDLNRRALEAEAGLRSKQVLLAETSVEAAEANLAREQALMLAANARKFQKAPTGPSEPFDLPSNATPKLASYDINPATRQQNLARAQIDLERKRTDLVAARDADRDVNARLEAHRNQPRPKVDAPSTDGTQQIKDFLEGAVLGDFTKNDSNAAIVGQVVGGLLPPADLRDITAAAADLMSGEGDGWIGMSLALLALVPGLDAFKGARKAARLEEAKNAKLAPHVEASQVDAPHVEAITPHVDVKVEPKIEPVVEPKIEPVVEPKIEPVVEPKIEPSPPGIGEGKYSGRKISPEEQEKLARYRAQQEELLAKSTRVLPVAWSSIELRPNVKLGQDTEKKILGSAMDIRKPIPKAGELKEPANFNYVIDSDGNPFTFPPDKNHSAGLPANNNVARAAGEIRIEPDGRVRVNLKSGHFMLKNQLMTNEHEVFEAMMRKELRAAGYQDDMIHIFHANEDIFAK